jgi:CopG family transcriptional regulator/antitoxin EndoAI
MRKRINIMLPERTLTVLDRIASRGQRSQFISEAVLHYVQTRGKRSLREHLKAGYQANADENLKIALEWFPLEEEAWQKSRATSKRKRSAT